MQRSITFIFFFFIAIKVIAQNNPAPPHVSVQRPKWMDGFLTRGTTRGEWYSYDARILLTSYGWNIPQGSTNNELYITDISPTIAALLHIQMRSGCIGPVIQDVVK